MPGSPEDESETLQPEHTQAPPPEFPHAGTSALSPDLPSDNFQQLCFSFQPGSFWPKIEVIARNASFHPLKMARNLTNLACTEIPVKLAHQRNIYPSALRNCFSQFAYNFP